MGQELLSPPHRWDSRGSDRIMSFFKKSSPKGIFSLLLEREAGREGNINVREKHLLVASHMHWATDHMHPDQGSNLQPRYVP